MASGKLEVSGKALKLRYTSASGKDSSQVLSQGDLSRPLASAALETLNGLEVEFDLVGGAPRKVRPVGQTWEPAGHQPRGGIAPGNSPRPRQSGGAPAHAQPAVGPTAVPAQAEVAAPPRGDFHNPYNFIPAPPREAVTGELGDREPAGHDRWHSSLFSGTLSVKLTVVTPLLLSDAAAMTVEQTEEGKPHKTFAIQMVNGKPYIAPTALKGMLRSAYEAVTNSRLAVFAEHKDRPAYRMRPAFGLRLVPAIIRSVAGGWHAELFPGVSDICPNDRPDGPMYAAWLPRYNSANGTISGSAVKWPGGRLPEHGERVRVLLELMRKGGPHPFEYWRVRAIGVPGVALSLTLPPSLVRGLHGPVVGQRMLELDGTACITADGPNIDNKHDERVFFSTRPTNPMLPVSDAVAYAWGELIRNYQDAHRKEIADGSTSPPALDHSIWSRHVTAGRGAAELRDGMLCYAEAEANSAGTGLDLKALYPVMISRGLQEASPEQLLPENLQPAYWIDRLSPADRVFGWVRQTDHIRESLRPRGEITRRLAATTAYRGNVRVGPLTCAMAQVDSFAPHGVPLAILGQPKDQQGRFYVAASRQGEPQADRLPKEQTRYRPGKGLRGRKVYPHHKGLPEGYWDNPTEDRTQRVIGGYCQEYRRPLDNGVERDSQNRSVLGWVRPGAEFTFDLHVTNLSRVELGALLFLLSLPEGGHHRLGGGKPLGFGSVRLELLAHDLRDGTAWREYYASLEEAPTTPFDILGTVAAFEQAVAAAYGRGASFITAFLRASTGFDTGLPVHYPRTTLMPNPAGEAFEWFMANDHNHGPGRALPALGNETGLPLL